MKIIETEFTYEPVPDRRLSDVLAAALDDLRRRDHLAVIE